MCAVRSLQKTGKKTGKLPKIRPSIEPCHRLTKLPPLFFFLIPHVQNRGPNFSPLENDNIWAKIQNF